MFIYHAAICSFLLVQAKADVSAEASKKFTQLLKSYDKRVRPHTNGSVVSVQSQISIITLGPVMEKDFTYRIDMYIRYWWHDPRLKLLVGDLTFNGNPKEIWIPDMYIKNSRSITMHASTTETIRTVIKRDGSVYLSARITAICNCKMDLRAYPMDNQTCTLVIESYSFSDKDLNLTWYHTPIEYNKQELQVEGYEVTSLQSELRPEAYAVNETFTNLMVSFKLKRAFTYYFYRSYIPSTFLVLMTWGSFWLPPTSFPARTALIVTNFLASAFILQGASSQITKVPYTTAIEIFLLINIMFILATMLEFIVVAHISVQGKNGKMKSCIMNNIDNDAGKHANAEEQESLQKEMTHDFAVQVKPHEQYVDRISRILFPVLYVMFIATYSLYYYITYLK